MSESQDKQSETEETAAKAEPTPEAVRSELVLDRHVGGEERLLETMDRFKTPILVGIVLIAGAFAFVSMRNSHATEAREEASRLLTEARTPEQIREVIDQYPQTPAAPAAALALAKEYYRNGEYAKARETYSAFTANYADHELAPVAEMGRIHCIEGEGKTEEALQGFTAFEKNHPEHFLASQAVLGHARCLELLGRLPDARVVYEDFIAKAGEDAPWVGIAEESLDRVNRGIRRTEGTL